MVSDRRTDNFLSVVDVLLVERILDGDRGRQARRLGVYRDGVLQVSASPDTSDNGRSGSLSRRGEQTSCLS